MKKAKFNVLFIIISILTVCLSFGMVNLKEKSFAGASQIYVIGGDRLNFHSEISDGKANNGGGIYFSDASYLDFSPSNLYETHAEIKNCTANYGGAIYLANSRMGMYGPSTTYSSTIYDCIANVAGGAIYATNSSVYIGNSAYIYNCEAAEQGGALYLDNSNCEMNYGEGAGNPSIWSCTANEGGAIYIVNSTFSMEGYEDYDYYSSIKNCTATNGGGIYVSDGAVVNMNGGVIDGCTAENGGAVYIASGGTFNFNSGTIKNCSAEKGYAIYVASGGTLDFTNSEGVFENCGEDEGLHIYAEEGANVIGMYGGTRGLIIEGTTVVGYEGTETDIVIPEGITAIGYGAFGYCWGDSGNINGVELTSIVLPSTLELIDYEAFGTANYGYYNRSSNITSINLPEGLKEIHDLPSGLTSLYIPACVTSISFVSSEGSGGLTCDPNTIDIADNNQVYSDGGNNAILSKDETVLYFACTMSYFDDGNWSLPYGLEIIGSCAFMYKDITRVYIPESVTNIGFQAFQGTDLTTISIPSSVTRVEGYCFWWCSNLERVELYCQTVEYSAFENCSSLNEVYIGEQVAELPSYLFSAASEDLEINCEQTSKPNGWNDKWNAYYDSGDKYFKVNWGNCDNGHDYVLIDGTDTCCPNVEGWYTYECSRCEDSYTEYFYGDTHSDDGYGYCWICETYIYGGDDGGDYGCDHNYVCIERIDATCEYDGEAVYECSYCFDTYVETISALGHDFQYWESDQTATCIRCGKSPYSVLSNKHNDIDLGLEISKNMIVSNAQETPFIKEEDAYFDIKVWLDEVA